VSDPYRKTARFYDAMVAPFNKSLRGYAVKVARPEAGMKVLEVGCGTGANLALFAEAGCEITGVDLSPAMMDVARRKLGDRADLRLGDAADMPFSDNSFDLVLSFLTLHEMPPASRTPVMNEIVRVAGADGKVLLVDFHPGPIHFPKGWFYKAVIYSLEFGAGWVHFQNHRDFLARNGLPKFIEDHSLSVAKEKILAGGNIQVALAARETPATDS
jgi:ubiquinone/menaquinone biosynthesis C-methylase UbiE